MTTVGRNDPCPCGSGLKFKRCHLGREGELAGDATAKVTVRRRSVPWVAIALGLVASGAVAVLRDVGSGLVVAAAWALGTGAWIIFRDPPPPNENTDDPAALNFGRKG